MTDQLDLDFEFRAEAPDVSDAEVERLRIYLTGRGWVRRRIIEADLGWNERKVRAVAESAAPKILSYPGSPGYKLFNSAVEIAEFELSDSKWSAQITTMIQRRAAFRLWFHSRCRE